MERPSQPPKTESCPWEGAKEGRNRQSERPGGSVDRENHGPQGRPASPSSDTASKATNAAGDVFQGTEPKIDRTEEDEGRAKLPGSKSVAREEGSTRNKGCPGNSRRTNYEGQAGKEAQREEEPTEGTQGVGSVHSSQSLSAQAESGKGADTLTKPEQETGPVRTTKKDWPTSLQAIAEKADRDKSHRFGDLYRLLNEQALRECFYRLRKDAASGVDGVSFQEYEKDLEKNLAGLVERLKRKSYRARLVRRKNIPKGGGKLRPLGIPVLEDKLLQLAVTQILQAIYERDFLASSYGYRPGLGAHDTIRELTAELCFKGHQFVVEADIRGFFDNIQWEWLEKMLGQRVADGALLGLIGKWLRAGILEEDGKVIHPQTGTPQGGVISPVLANVYLHYVLDLWFERKVKRENRGRSELFRYADDFVACFAYRHEAQAFEGALKERLAKFGLEVAEEKTKTLRFGRNGGPRNGRFDFLGFEFYWEADRKGRPTVKRRTARKKFRASVQRMKEWIKAQRHDKLEKTMRSLRSKLRGTWNYYGVIGNGSSLSQFEYITQRALFYWLNRRSQRRSYTWRRFHRMIDRFQWPRPRIREKPKQRMPCQLELSLCQRLALRCG